MISHSSIICSLFTCLSFFADADPANSYCRKGGVYYRATTTTDCTTGEVFLRGAYVEVGIHNVGSYGTSGGAPTGSAYAGKRLGFIADFSKDGWASGPTGAPIGGVWKFSGDYFVPGSPVEGSHNLLYELLIRKIISDFYKIKAGFCSGQAPLTRYQSRFKRV